MRARQNYPIGKSSELPTRASGRKSSELPARAGPDAGQNSNRMAGERPCYGSVESSEGAECARHGCFEPSAPAIHRRRVPAHSRTVLAGVCATALLALLAAANVLSPEAEAAGRSHGAGLTALASLTLAASNGKLAIGDPARLQAVKQQCPCAVARHSLLSQQAVKECPCAAAIAAAVTRALDSALDRTSVNNFAYGRSSPGAPPKPLVADVGGAPAPMPPGIEPQAVGPTPAEAANGAKPSYMNVIQTLTRDVVADAHMIQDLQAQQQQLLSQQNAVANQVDTFQAMPGPVGAPGAQGAMGVPGPIGPMGFTGNPKPSIPNLRVGPWA